MKQILILAAYLALLSCNPAKVTENQVYVLGFDFYADKCEVYPECDCCSGDLVLLPGNKFAIIDRCLDGDTYYSGQYSMNENQLKLTFNRKIVNEIQDEDYNVVDYVAREIDLNTEVFEIKNCGSRIHLLNKMDSSAWWNGSRYEYNKEKEIMTELLQSKPWIELTK